jgi:hypothetical protein
LKTSSAKAKGRKLQQWVCQQISDIFGVPWGPDEQIASREMGQNGVDIRLTGDIAKLFKWAIECKNQENWSVHQWIEQARTARDKDKLNCDWLVIAKRNHQDPVAIIDAKVFFNLIKEIEENTDEIIDLCKQISRGD